VAIADAAGYDFSLLRGVIEVNDLQLERCVDKIAGAVGSLPGAKVGLWGLAFKAGTDDVRESPAVKIGKELLARGATVTAYDPAVGSLDDTDIRVVDDPVEAAKGADVLVVATEWPQFVGVDLRVVRNVMAGNSIVDVRNLLDPLAVRQLGMQYMGIGR
jgi:UDPglucose 6-dehydrogenase